MQTYTVHWENGTLYLLHFTIGTVAKATLLCDTDQLPGEHTGSHPYLVQDIAFSYIAVILKFAKGTTRNIFRNLPFNGVATPERK